MLHFLIISALVASAWGQVSQQEFNEGFKSNGYNVPSQSAYDGYIRSLRKATIQSKMEAAMFLAQIMHESTGLQDKSEIRCTRGGQSCDEYQSGDWNPDCPRSYPGRRFYGRGYLQLTYCSNYRAASLYLGLGDKLPSQPDLVAQDDNLAWDTSAYYWKVNVQAKDEYQKNPSAFGITTKLINGREECNGANRDKSERRFRYYSNIFSAFRLPGAPNPSGCY